MADNQNPKETKSTFEEMLNIYRDLNAEVQKQIQSVGVLTKEGAKNLKDHQDIAATMDDIAANQKDSMELSQISENLEEKLLVAKAEGNKELQKEIQLAQKLVKIKKKENQAQENINESMKEIGGQIGLGGVIEKMEKWKELSGKEGGGVLQQLFLVGLAIGGVIALVSAVADITDEVGNKFGAIGVTQFQSQLVGAKSTAISLGYDFEEVAGSVSELSNNFGVSFGEAVKISEASMDTARALGISTDQAAGLTGQLMIIAGHSAESAQNFLKQTAALAASAGVAPAAVMEDIAGSSEEVATFTKGSGENIAQAAVKARQMGMNLADVAKIADGLLDFGSSLEAEMTASVMIGRQLNLQKARELALAGELGALQDEILTQVGSEADFLAMNTLQRKALADAVGVGVAEMSKMVSEAGKGTEELARMRELDLSEIASDEAISNITLFMNNLKAIGVTILGAISSVTNFFASFGDGWGVVGTILTLLGIAIIGIGLYLASTALSAYATGLGLTKAGVAAKFAGKGLASMAAAGTAAVPLLLTIAAVAAALGIAFFGIGYIMKQMPPVARAMAKGFKMVAETITASILQLATPEVVMGIYGLAGAFFMLAGALASVAVTGVAAIPAMAAITGFTAAMTALNAIGGGNEAEQQNQTEALKMELQEIKTGINKLVKGFGGDPGTDGEYITDFAGKIPKTTKLVDGLI